MLTIIIKDYYCLLQGEDGSWNQKQKEKQWLTVQVAAKRIAEQDINDIRNWQVQGFSLIDLRRYDKGIDKLRGYGGQF